jgi:Tol biopolymer transport system component
MPFILLFVCSIWALPFGKNKVQYQYNDWQQFQTVHFDIYFTLESKQIALYTADHIENIYGEILDKLGHNLTARVPIVIHKSHAHFQGTNVIRQTLPEAVGGFTEVFKNRIVLPFDGSYARFHHVLQHELVHAVMFNFFAGGGGGGISLARKMSHIPLWFSEGMAEWVSLNGWNIESEFYMIDAISFGYATPPTVNYGGFMAYRGGQNFLFYLEESFGKGTIKTILRRLKQGYSIEASVHIVCKVSLEELGELWLRELRQLYWPELGLRQHGKDVARQLTKRQEEGNFLNVNPKVSPDGKYIVFFSDRSDWEGWFLYDVEKKEVTQRLLKSGSDGGHESFHPFSSSVGWSPNSKQVVFANKQRGLNVLYTIDVETLTKARIADLEMDIISSPDWSRDSNKIVFSGMKNGKQDLYTWNLNSNKLTQYTADRQTQEKPTWSPNGNSIAYQTNANHPRNSRRKDYHQISILDIQSGLIKKVTQGQWDHKNPIWLNDSSIIYTSNKSGVENIYLHNLNNDSSWAITNILSSAFNPSVTYDGTQMVFSLFEAGGWEMFLMSNPLEKKIKKELPQTHFIKHRQLKNQSFWDSIDLKNLSSYDSTYMDSVIYNDSLKSLNQTKKDTLLASKKSKRIEVDSITWDEYFPNQSLIIDSINSNKGNDIKNNTDSNGLHYGVDTTMIFYHDTNKTKKLGEYIQKPYQTQWSLDQAVAAAGAASNGTDVAIGGQAFLSFTDLMGDQQITAMLYSSGSSLRDINAFLSYDYLPYKWDVSVRGYNNSNQLREVVEVDTTNTTLRGDFLTDSVSIDTLSTLYTDGQIRNTLACKLFYGSEIDTTYSVNNGVCRNEPVFHDQSYGIGATLTYPFSVFSRVSFSFDYARMIRSLQKWKSSSRSYIDNQDVEEMNLDRFEMAAEWAFDNSRWGVVGPINGSRYALGIRAMPPRAYQGGKLGFVVLDSDLRKYLHFFKKYTLALRTSAGVSYGWGDTENPHKFLVGGDFFTLNYRSNDENLDGTQRQRYFSRIETPMRGFHYYDFVGNHKWINNVELRLPFIERLTLGWPPITFTKIMGNLFMDYGGAWQSGEKAWDNMGLGFGWGLRMNLGVFVLKYTRAWDNDYLGEIHHGEVDYWSLGAEF